MLSFYLMSRDDYGADRYGAEQPVDLRDRLCRHRRADAEARQPVIVSRCNSVKKSETGVLIVAEPGLYKETDTTVPALLRARQDAVRAAEMVWHPRQCEGRLDRARAAPMAARRQRLLALAVAGARKSKKRATVESWPINKIGMPPPRIGELQVIKGSALTPIVANGDQILIGEIRKNGRQIWVLSDPDLIANHAFGPDGKGAVFAVKMIEALRGGSGPIVFDESDPRAHRARRLGGAAALHIPLQHHQPAGRARHRAPALGDHGPVRAARDRARDAGWRARPASSTMSRRLMGYAGHEKLMVRRYVEAMINDTGRQLHAPKGLHQAELIKWLQRVGEARNVSLDGGAVAARADDLVRMRGVGDMGPYRGGRP